MTRCSLFAAGLALALAAPASAEDKKEPAGVNLSGSVENTDLAKEAPAGGVIASQKAYEKLATAWGIKDAPKVDFSKHLLAVATTRGSRLSLNAKLDAKGDLKVVAISTRDLRPGFRYQIKSVSREGVKTVNGKELPKQ